MPHRSARTSRSGGTAPRLAAQGVSKSYGSVRALQGVDFELRPGEVMALLGENGAGKSTFVKVLGGLVDPDAGSIAIDGEPVVLHPSARSQAAGVAVVHQEYSSVPSLTVAENLVLGQEVGSRRVWLPARLRRHATELLRRVGLDQLDPGRTVQELSSAEVQLVEVARVLSRDARIVIFDEPTAALSDHEIERVHRVIRRLASEGRSIVYVTHRLPEVFAIADRVTVFRNGASSKAIETQSLTTDAVVEMMLGRELSEMFPPRPSQLGDAVLEVEGLLADGWSTPLSLTLRQGEILGLTGQIGSGAHAVVQALAGRSRVRAGAIRLHGRPLSLRGRRAGLRRGVAYCSADRKRDGVFLEKPVRTNLSAPTLSSVAHAGWLSRRREQELALRIGAQFAIEPARQSTPVGRLSGGNQQKVALGRWLGVQPSVLLVEEPTRGVDVGARAEIYRHLRAMCSSGAAILMASSDAGEVLGLSDTIATFYRGSMQSLRPHERWTESALTLEVMHTVEAAS